MHSVSMDVILNDLKAFNIVPVFQNYLLFFHKTMEIIIPSAVLCCPVVGCYWSAKLELWLSSYGWFNI